MERLSPIPAEEPIIPETTGGSTARTFGYSLLALMLAGGAWVRFNDQIASVAPGLAAPAASLARHAAPSTGVASLLELSMLPQTATPDVSALALPAGDAAAMTEALRRNRLRLVQLPLFDAGIATPDGIGRTVLISSGGYTRLVRLSRHPVLVTLPIDRVGTVTFRLPPGAMAGTPLDMGALTTIGPVQLPDLTPGQELDVGVVAQ